MCKRLTKQEVTRRFKNEGLVLLSEEYVNARQKLLYKCSKGHENHITLTNFSNGKRCPECYKESTYLNTQDVKRELQKEGYVLLSEYKNNYTKLKLVCPKKHEIHMTWASFNTGSRCLVCSRKTRTPTSEQIQEELQCFGYSFTYYKQANTPMKVVCPKGHKTSMYIHNLRRGHRCLLCKLGEQISKPSQEWLDKLNINTREKKIYIDNNSFVRVDGIEEEKNLVYEFLGDYYHGNPDRFESNKPANRKTNETFGDRYEKTFQRFDKLKACGYGIFYIWEYDYVNGISDGYFYDNCAKLKEK